MNTFTTYSEEKQFIKENVKQTIHFLEVNKVLDKYGWHFINPYIQVYKLNSLLKQEQKGILNQKKVNSFFIEDFYNLDRTLSFIDGYFKRSEFISKFNYFIEHSLILCFQRDYAGAINLIVPVIEGVLSDYIINYRGVNLKKGNRYVKIKKSVKQIIESILLNIEDSYKSTNYKKNEIESLLKLHRNYYENWGVIINDFFENSLFAHTDKNPPDNTLNRHSLIHLLELKKYYTLENYIKLFNSLKFLVWLFLTLEKKSFLNEIEKDVYIKKRLLYEELITQSKKIIPIKHSILKNYELNNDLAFSLNFDYNSLGKELSFFGKLYLKMKTKLLLKRSKEELDI